METPIGCLKTYRSGFERPLSRCRAPAIISLVLALSASACSDPVNEDVLRGLKADLPKCERQFKSFRNEGLVQRVVYNSDGINLIVDEVRWLGAEHRTKVSVALVAYCLYSPSDGRYEITVKGVRGNRTLATLLNGHYWSK